MTDPKHPDELGEQALDEVSGGARIVSRGGSGTAPTAPGVAKTPAPGGPIPIPYPNTGVATDGPKTKSRKG